MGKPRFNKWLEDVQPDDPVDDVLVKSLESRFDAVCHFLPLAAEHPEENVESVHELRVWTRRAMAVLHLYKPRLSKKRVRWLRKKLKQIRDAAGAARDCDVLLERHRCDPESPQSQAFLDRLRRQRHEAQQPIVCVSARLKCGKRLKRKVRRLIDAMPCPAGSKTARRPFARWARQPLGRLVKRFELALPSDPTDLAALHQFRIRGKQLRYGMELLAPAFPVAIREQIYPRLQQLQERLGDLNDHAVAVRRFEDWIKAEDDPDIRRHLCELLQREIGHRDQSVRDFKDWWSPERMQRLLGATERLLL